MELIKVYQGNLVSARELYAFFESRERFSRWFTRMKEYGFTEGVDYFEHATKADNNRAITDYLLKLNTAKRERTKSKTVLYPMRRSIKKNY